MHRTLLVLLLLLALPASAGAATVTGAMTPPTPIGEPGGDKGRSTFVFYVAAPGESNELTVSSTGSRTQFKDVVPLTAAGLCTQVDPTTADCPTVSSPTVDLGDQADVFGTGAGFTGDIGVDGGPGDDRLVGGPGSNGFSGEEGDDTLIGGATGDGLVGGPGSDRVTGGGGNDTLRGGPAADPGQDSYDGGAGVDGIDFLEAQEPVTIVLDDGVTRSGGRDAVVGIEGAQGGTKDDTLVGTPGPNLLRGSSGTDAIEGLDGADDIDGGFGADRLSGGGGDDRIADGIGPDTVDAGTGDDLITVDDDFYGNGADTFACGAGIDTLTALGRRDRATGCERQRLQYGATVVDVVRVVRRAGTRRWTVRLRCVPAPSAQTCETRTSPLLRLDRRGRQGRVLARATRPLNRLRTSARVTFVLSIPAARRLRKAGRRVHFALSDFGNQDAVPLRLPG